MDIALIVKSRRAASTRQSSVQATSACRPSVSRSRRSVVTSKPRWSLIAVTVPCFSPVGADFSPAAVSSCHHALRRVGRGEVDVGDRALGQRVAHAAADQARPRQRVQHGTQRGIAQEMRRRHARRRRLGHAPWPGTIRPSRNWAGT